MTFKDDSGDYSAPTEVIPINNCCTVKSADDELNIKNSFVSPFFHRLVPSTHRLAKGSALPVPYGNEHQANLLQATEP